MLLCAGVLGFLHEQLRPDVADPSLRRPLAERAAFGTEPVVTRTALGEAPDGPCGLLVRVVDADGEPVAGAEVAIELDGPDEPLADEADTDDLGEVRWRGMPCGVLGIRAEAEDLGTGTASALVLEEQPLAEATVVLRPQLWLEGRVEGGFGDPVAGARLSSGPYSALSDPQGRYRLQLHYEALPGVGEQASPRWVSWLNADALGYAADGLDVFDVLGLDGPDGREVYELDIVLDPVREISIFCAGLPDDECGEMLLSCTHPYQPFGEPCHDSYDQGEPGVQCVCEVEGTVAIRGGGRSVLVPAGEHEAWLDFRDTGSLVGRVEALGEPAVSCTVSVLRIPHGLEDLPRGLVNAHRARCDDLGRFEVLGLTEGDWEIVASGGTAEGDWLERTLVPRPVRVGRTTDVGTIELDGGGSVSGRLVDGLTGAPMARKPVLALRQAAEGERTTPYGTDTDPDGHFEMSGLAPGTWRLSYLLSPHEHVEVVVREGQEVTGVVVQSSDATALDANGFELVDEDGELVVDFVDTGSPAMEGGLEPGDEITGLLLGGFDLSGVAGGHSPELTRLVLGHWDGPGVTLIVEREGEEREVPLEW